MTSGTSTAQSRAPAGLRALQFSDRVLVSSNGRLLPADRSARFPAPRSGETTTEDGVAVRARWSARSGMALRTRR